MTGRPQRMRGVPFLSGAGDRPAVGGGQLLGCVSEPVRRRSDGGVVVMRRTGFRMHPVGAAGPLKGTERPLLECVSGPVRRRLEGVLECVMQAPGCILWGALCVHSLLLYTNSRGSFEMFPDKEDTTWDPRREPQNAPSKAS